MTLALWVKAGTRGMPIDDAYIFERYVHNIVNGMGYCFNPGEVSFGVTSFIWTLLNAAIIKILPFITFHNLSQAMGIIFFAATVALVELWVYRELKNVLTASLTGFLYMLSPMAFMHSISGMETSLYIFALLGFIYMYRFYGLNRAFAMGFAAGFVFLVRPEGLYLPAAVICVEALLAIVARDRKRIRRLPFFAAGFLLISFPLILFTKLNTPGWLPTTYYGKMVGAVGCYSRGVFDELIEALHYMTKGHGRTVARYGVAGGIAWAAALLWAVRTTTASLTSKRFDFGGGRVKYLAYALLAAAAVLAQFWRLADLNPVKVILAIAIVLLLVALQASAFFTGDRHKISEDGVNELGGHLALAGLFFLPLVYGLFFRTGPVFGGYYNRYIAVMVPAMWIMAARGAQIMLRDKTNTAKIYYAAISVYSFVLFAGAIGDHVRIYRNEVKLNEVLRSSAAEWIRENTPPDAVVMTGYTGLGVVGGKCGRYVVDMGALINPDAGEFYRDAPCLPSRRWPRTVAYMKHRDVSYFVTVPGIPDDPHSDPKGTGGFELAARIEKPEAGQLGFKCIEIWRLDYKR